MDTGADRDGVVVAVGGAADIVVVQTLAEERRKREVDPTLSLLRDALLETPAGADDAHAQARMREMHDLIELTVGWFEDVRAMEQERLVELMKLGRKVGRLLDARDRFLGGGKSND